MAAALGCTCILSASAAGNYEGYPSYSKILNLKSGQTVTTKIYIKTESPTPIKIAGAQVNLVHDVNALDYSERVKSIPEDELSSELCPNFPGMLINLHPELDPDHSMFSLMGSINNGFDLSNRTLFASVEFDVKKSGATNLNAYMVSCSEDNSDDDFPSMLQYAKIEQEILINGYKLGDVTEDNAISIADAILIQKRIVGISTFDELEETLSDIDGNGTTTIADAIAVQKYIVGILTAL